MKLKLILTTAIVGVALAVPSASSAQAPTQDSVTSQPGMPFIVSLDASSGPLGENPTGVVAWHEGGGFGTTWSGDVSCLSVSGNTAVIGFGGGRLSGFFDSYWIAGLIRVADNGSGLDDTFEWVELQTGEPGLAGDPLPGPADCSSFPPGAQILPLSQNSPFSAGDIVVTDAQPPLPTSKEQCKNGGWRNFPQFRNQGQCIAFVNHAP
jgi:hypothetical protein